MSARMRNRLADSARAFSANARNPSLLRSQLAYGTAWTAEWAFTVAIGVVAFRDGGAAAVGVVAFVRMAPSAFLAPLGTTLADRFPRGLVDSVSLLLGPLLAALLLDVGSPAAVFALAAALSLGSGALLLNLSYEAPPRGLLQPLRRIARETVEGYRAFGRYREAGLLMGLGLAQTLTRGFFNVFVVVVALELLGIG